MGLKQRRQSYDGVTAHASRHTRTSRARRKVVLYNPRAVFFTMPLALVTVGSHLDPERYKVVIIDARLESNPVAAVTAHLDDAICLGVTVLTGAPIRDAMAMSRAAKAYRRELPVIWGGWHPSLFSQACFDELSVDVTVQGQGEETLLEVVDRLTSGQSLEGCHGCTYRTPQDEVCSNRPTGPLRDINTFRTHDYSLTRRRTLLYPQGQAPARLYFLAGLRLSLCLLCRPVRLPPALVAAEARAVGDEIAALWQRYRFDDVNFQDETFFSNAPRVLAIAEEFLRRQLPITWAATMRADQCWRLSEEVFATCKASGLRRVLIGVESGSQEMMDADPEGHYPGASLLCR